MWTKPRYGAALLFVLLLAACGSDPGFNKKEDFASKEGRVQFVNMMPDSPEVTIIHGFDQTQVPFPVSAPIEVRFEDKYDWRIAYLDSSGKEITVIKDENQQITEDFLSTFLFMGSIQQPDVQIVDREIVPLEDKPADMADVWFASNITNHPMVDIYITDFGAEITASTVLTTLTSGSSSQQFSVGAGTEKQLRITVAGSVDILFDSGSIEIPENSLDLYALVDDFGPSAADHVDVIRSLTVAGSDITDVSQSGSARLGNFTSFETIEATIGSVIFPSTTQEDRSTYQEVADGEQTLIVTSDGTQLEELVLNVRLGIFQSVYTFDNVDAQTQPATNSLIVPDEHRPIVDRSLFKFVNGSNQTVDLYALRDNKTLENSLPLIDDISLGGTATNEALSEVINFVVTSSDATETLASLVVDLMESESYTLIFEDEGIIQALTH